jgi:hypothetical protein
MMSERNAADAAVVRAIREAAFRAIEPIVDEIDSAIHELKGLYDDHHDHDAPAVREAVREVEELIDHVRKVAVSATRIAARIGLHGERRNKRP